ncbi:MAG: hypothetical protein J5762_06995 [Clostridia bacterium]|nr:hypothetical protein [Clostridia bacterium]
MKKSVYAKLMSLFLVASLGFSVAACDNIPKINNGDDAFDVSYNDEKLDPAGAADAGNSWTYISAADKAENYTINWYVDVSTWPMPTGKDAVSKRIKEVTGLTVKFETPVSDDGTKLNTMIAGNKLPDVISMPTSNLLTLSLLAKDGLVYDINGLADRYAHSLYEHLPEDVLEWWAYGNGKTYGVPNHYYSYSDVPEGEQLQPNGGMMVRKDLFDSWQEHVSTDSRIDGDGMLHYTSLSGAAKTVEWQGYITTPEGFKEAAKWALANYKGTGNGNGKITTGLLLSQFKADGCTSLGWLSQFFAIPYEDESGNYQYAFTQESYKEMLMYLNDLYNEGIISKGNFTQNFDGIGGTIASGAAFATLVTPQDYQMHFLTAHDTVVNGKSLEYVSMYITNENGDAPVLSDIRGYGYLMNMITTGGPLSKTRPDLIIKLFDYLTSPEGQLLVTLGVEGETWNYTDSTKTATAFTETYLEEKAKLQTAKYGLMQFDVLINYQYYDNMQPRVNNGKTEGELYRTNLKRPLTIYSYDCNVSHFVIDATDSRYNDYDNALTRINNVLGRQVPKIIQAASRSEAESVYNTTIGYLNSYNLDIVLQMNAESYAKTKAKLGLTNGWPAYQEGYNMTPDRLHPNGDLSLYRSY